MPSFAKSIPKIFRVADVTECSPEVQALIELLANLRKECTKDGLRKVESLISSVVQQAVKAAKEERKSATKKDPNAPKRPMTAFFFFNKSKKEEMDKKFPKMKIAERAQHLAKEWKALSAKDRKPFEEQAVADKERYQKAIAEYNAANKPSSSATPAPAPKATKATKKAPK
jgi:hypothetical protein